MTEASGSQIQFSAAEQGDLTRYRTVSHAAVASLVLGLLSILALLQPLLWFLPAAAAIASIVALRSISANETALIGRKAALAGLALALLVSAWGVSYAASRRIILYNQARRYTDRWFELVQAGKLYQAHQLTLTLGERQAEGVSLEHLYGAVEGVPKAPLEDGVGPPGRPESPHAKLVSVFGKSPMRDIARYGEKAKLKYLGPESQMYMPTRHTDSINLRYRFSTPEGEHKTLRVNCLRVFDGASDAVNWQMNTVTEVTDD